MTWTSVIASGTCRGGWASGGAVPSASLVAAYDQLRRSYETPSARPSEAEALAAAEGTLTTPGLGVGGLGFWVRVGLWLS